MDQKRIGETDKNRDRHCDSIRKKTQEWLDKQSRKIAKEIKKDREADNPFVNKPFLEENLKLQLASAILKTLQRRMQMCLCNAKYATTLSRRVAVKDREERLKIEKKYELEAESCREEAHLCYELAIELNRYVQQDAIRYQERLTGVVVLQDEAALWFDDQQRLDTQHAHCLAMKGEYIKSHRRLNEAEANLVELPHYKGLELGIIELHRADVLLREAIDGNNAKTSRLVKFRRGVLQAFAKEGDMDWSSLVAAAQGIAQENQTQEDIEAQKEPSEEDKGDRLNINKTLSLIEDCWQTLDRAKPILEHYRKSAWWTAEYFELRMKLIELRLFSAIQTKPMSRLPFIGTQDVPYSLTTMADMLLDNSRRIIRDDIYRLARIVESYSNCLLVLKIWLHEAGEENIDEIQELSHRERTMRLWLTSSYSKPSEDNKRTRVTSPLVVLKNLLERRTEWDDSHPDSDKTLPPEGNGKLSENVRLYAEGVLKHVRKVCKQSD